MAHRLEAEIAILSAQPKKSKSNIILNFCFYKDIMIKSSSLRKQHTMRDDGQYAGHLHNPRAMHLLAFTGSIFVQAPSRKSPTLPNCLRQ